MKKIKRMMAIAIAIALSVATCGAFSVFAADPTNYTITLSKDSSDKADHTYGAYQLFKGDLAEVEGKKTLSNIQWGDSIDSSKVDQLLTNLNDIDGLTVAAGSSAATVAKAIGDASFTNDSVGAQAIADAFAKALGSPKTTQNTPNAEGKYVLTVPAGYYLVKDTTAVSGEGAQTRYILEVVSNVTPTEKASVPTVTKKVKEKNDTTGSETGWQDAADYDIGDPVPFQLTGTLPSTFADYDTYKVYTFIDTLSKGLTPPETTGFSIKADGKDVTSRFSINITDGQDGAHVITISLKANEDLKTWTDPALTKDSKIVVEYSATLNENAVIGTPGNPNTVKLEFTNNPNGEQNGEYGTTPEDKVVVFTYEIKALKVEADGNAKTQAEYNALTDAEKADYVKVGDKWQKTKALSGAGFTLYKKVPTTVDASGYKAVGDEVTGATTFEFKGTDAGEYKLVETTVPAGYNKAEDIEIKVEATYDTDAADPKLISLTVKPDTAGFVVTTTADSSSTDHITTDGIITGKVLNQSGAQLPSTGGSGTTMIYIIGVILLAGAGILLVTRRRMKAE